MKMDSRETGYFHGKIISGWQNVPPDLPPSAVTVGNFDGVHRGHQRILEKAVERAHGIEGISIAFTFDPHPLRFLNPMGGPPLLTTWTQKAHWIQAAGIDLLVCAAFDEAMLSLSPRQFLQEVLLSRLKMREIIEGPGFTFGTGRSGTVETLCALGEELGFGVTILEPVTEGQEIITSTRIRELLCEGAVEQAAQFLGRPYSLEGSVVDGQRRGRTLGFPTANLDPENELIPRTGVYAVLVEHQSHPYPGVTNVGYSPTFEARGLTVETHILDFQREIYGQEISLHFIQRLRSELKFSGPEELIRQMERDVQEARKAFKMIETEQRLMEILREAIEKEKDSQAHFQQGAAVATNPEIREMFLQLMAEEKQHEQILRKRYIEVKKRLGLKLMESEDS
ncbi:MAG: bifunctional riboflavin kinase/FAD synthetase [Candidatus Tectomicrobia bacterium]|uniref:Bifunctional riboflavin kinase/FMN adenylyltransferase n=1 Tax=Tectimicrobiota bacterium TaxID=2528274 RepID=A0A932CLC9_UNCTE|nr:bifunctional riboflavin kinase/FAD synthetase [Candidatus Tectomicrobia bacterium]